jgi:hypothetical protein
VRGQSARPRRRSPGPPLRGSSPGRPGPSDCRRCGRGARRSAHQLVNDPGGGRRVEDRPPPRRRPPTGPLSCRGVDGVGVPARGRSVLGPCCKDFTWARQNCGGQVLRSRWKLLGAGGTFWFPRQGGFATISLACCRVLAPVLLAAALGHNGGTGVSVAPPG